MTSVSWFEMASRHELHSSSHSVSVSSWVLHVFILF